jgi:two-component system nitrogen regulation sensor histidine kinase NtrY
LDKGQIKRVFINLLENAVDAIGKDGTIEVSTEYEKKKNIIRVEVADNGPGIPPKDMARLFEPYFSTKKGGTGLGLAIVDTIMKDHKGTIRVRKNTPYGTRFILGLPLSA